uniref:Uncharacterized protein n=1 Tax=Salarias fasciatus TaxID=181472 RepID=A0A672IYM9_SALFA
MTRSIYAICASIIIAVVLCEWLLQTGLPQMELPAVSPYLIPTGNPWDPLSHRVVEPGNSALEPQNTISRLVDSMRCL